MNKCKAVTLCERKIRSGAQYSLCLNYYPDCRDNVTAKVITHEALGIYIFVKPINQQERDFNAHMMEKAITLYNRRCEAIFNEDNDFFNKTKTEGDFLIYFRGLTNHRNIR